MHSYQCFSIDTEKKLIKICVVCLCTILSIHAELMIKHLLCENIFPEVLQIFYVQQTYSLRRKVSGSTFYWKFVFSNIDFLFEKLSMKNGILKKNSSPDELLSKHHYNNK